ncbi:MAG: LamG-like jellyroll fold domain-containing protein [Chthoniobacteraceae bacterium]
MEKRTSYAKAAMGILFWASIIGIGAIRSAFGQTPLFQYDFNETGTTAVNTGTASNGNLTLYDINGLAADIHTPDAGGYTGLAGDRGLDNTAAGGMGAPWTGRWGQTTSAASVAIGGLRSFSIEGWFKANEAICNAARLVDLTNSGSGFYLSGGSTPGTLSLGINNTYYATSTAAYDAVNSWVFFRVTYDSSITSNNVCFYVGRVGTGVSFVNSVTIANAPAVINPSVGLAVGNTRGAIRPFHGVLDGIKIYGSKTDGSAVPLFQYKFSETGSNVRNTGSALNGDLTLYNSSGAVADMHSGDAGGLTGLTGDRAFDGTSATGMGSSYIGPFAQSSASASAAIDGLQSFTIQGWFNASEAIRNVARLVDLTNTGSGFYLSGGGTPGTLSLGINNTCYATSPASFSTVNTWVFFAVTYDASLSANNVNFYCGGLRTNAVQWVGASTISNTPVIVDPRCGIGIGNTRGPIRPFHGKLDNVAIYGSRWDDRGARTLFELESSRLADIAAVPAAVYSYTAPAAQNLVSDNGRGSGNGYVQWCNTFPQSGTSSRMVGSSFAAPYSFILDKITVEISGLGSAAAGAPVSVSILDMGGSSVPATGGTVTGALVLQTDSGIVLPSNLADTGYLSFDISNIQLEAGRTYGFVLKFDSALASNVINLYASDTPLPGTYGYGFQSYDNGTTYVLIGAPLHYCLSCPQNRTCQVLGDMVVRAVNGPAGAWFTYPHSNGFWRPDTSWNPATYVVARKVPNNVYQLVEFDPSVGTQQISGSIPNLDFFFYSIANCGTGVCSTGTNLTLFDLTGTSANRTLASVGAGSYVDQSDISADGATVVTHFAHSSAPTSYQLAKVDVNSGNIQTLLTTSWWADHAHFSPYDSCWVSFSHETGTPVSDRLWAWNATSALSGTCFTVTGTGGQLLMFAHERSMFHKGGVVAVGMGAEAGLYEVDYNGAYRCIVRGSFDHCNISRDGRWMVADRSDVTGQNMTIVAINFQSGATQVLYSGTMQEHPWHGHPHISPDGKWVIFNDYSLQRTIALEIDQTELNAFLQ